MGTGIGKDCQICGEQLNYDDGFNLTETICIKCEELIPKVMKYLSDRLNKEE